MRLTLSSIAAILCFTFSACGSESRQAGDASTRSPSGAASDTSVAHSGAELQQQSEISLLKVSGAQPHPEAAGAGRKIIRDAELTIESQSPEESYRRVASLAEAKGGFVVTSEATQQEGSGEQGRVIVSVVLRVPAAQFDAAIEEIRKAGDRVLQDKRTGQDVTEEYIDLEARLQAKRALESQFLEIMKQAQRVSDALEVQRQLAEVRGEIEQVEGRRRFLENRSSLSTIKVTIRPPAQLMGTAAGGFFGAFREAVGDGVDAATAIILVLLRVVIALLPILLLVVLPVALVVRYWARRIRRTKAI